jgi:hypothetical protein
MRGNKIKDTASGPSTLSEQMEALSPSPKLAKLLEEITGNSAVATMLKQHETAAARISERLRANSAAAEWINGQESAVARIRKQLSASSSSQPAYLDALSAIAESVNKTMSELARAAEFSRAPSGLTEAMRAAEQWRTQIPTFDFPALPELNFLVPSEIDLVCDGPVHESRRDSDGGSRMDGARMDDAPRSGRNGNGNGHRDR